jgi:hypothetical protein
MDVFRASPQSGLYLHKIYTVQQSFLLAPQLYIGHSSSRVAKHMAPRVAGQSKFHQKKLRIHTS